MSDSENLSQQSEASSLETETQQQTDKRVQKTEKRAIREEKRMDGELKGQKVRNWTERLLARTTSGLIYAALIVLCLYLGPQATAILVAAMAWLCCSEFYRMMRVAGRMPNEILGLCAALAFPLSTMFDVVSFGLVGAIFLLSVFVWYVFSPRANISDVALTVFGAVYTSMLFSSVVLIRLSDPGFDGALLTFGVMGSVWANDSLAYLVGSRFGKHKLVVRISPNKSWEGAAGGLVGGVLVWIVLAVLGVRGMTLPLAIVGGILSGLAGLIGDLAESRIKRAAGVKDSGNLMPGHGGLLDRSDSMLFACVVAYIVLQLGGII
ncbi:MAG: phosphatidate cytidylyltransferase [Atopobiaceae bacterium]|nr:phosphatidate cytidylyltransferase [Atopobiaceae bacterium]